MVSLLHYYLMTVKLTFVDSEGTTGITDVAVVNATERNIVTVKELSQAQQGAQMRLFSRVGEVNVIDAQNVGVFYLGQMTEEEFNVNAEGVTVVAPDAPANDSAA